MKLSEYWQQHYEKASSDFKESPLKQIGKTVNGSEVREAQLNLITSQIAGQLGLQRSDCLADLGCGNGVLTVRFANIVRRVKGLDFTDGLLSYARAYNKSRNLEYIKSDLRQIDQELLDDVNVLVMYEVLQHLSVTDFSVLLSSLWKLDRGARFLIGGIPNKEKIKSFYNTDRKYLYYLECERAGKPHLGRWWAEPELKEIAASFGWVASCIPQPAGLYTSHYRFDSLLVKK